ncbi:MAG TPA: DMT family transporter [Agitococcus sp.]|nr:DMT family transporter [Agitococcus sp.]
MSAPISAHISPKTYWMGAACVALSALLFSTKSVFVKMAYQYPIDSTILLALRMAFALPFFVLMLWFNRSTTPIKANRQHYIGLVIAGVVGYYGASIFDFWGMEYISASLERLILFMYPTLTVILSALFLRQRIQPSTWLAIIISYTGMALVFLGHPHEESTLFRTNAVIAYLLTLQPFATVLCSQNALIAVQCVSPELVLGSSLVFAGALAYAGYLVGSGVLIPQFGAVRFTAFALMIATVCCFIQYLVSHPLSVLSQLPREVWLLSAVLGFFCTFLPATLLTQGIKRIGASQAALISGISPVITLALGAWLLNEQLTLWQFLGAGLILMGVIFISYKPQ